MIPPKWSRKREDYTRSTLPAAAIPGAHRRSADNGLRSILLRPKCSRPERPRDPSSELQGGANRPAVRKASFQGSIFCFLWLLLLFSHELIAENLFSVVTRQAQENSGVEEYVRKKTEYGGRTVNCGYFFVVFCVQFRLGTWTDKSLLRKTKTAENKWRSQHRPHEAA